MTNERDLLDAALKGRTTQQDVRGDRGLSTAAAGPPALRMTEERGTGSFDKLRAGSNAPSSKRD